MALHVITGSSSGLGEALATELCRRGDEVIGVARSPAPSRLPVDLYQHVAGDIADHATVAAIVAAVASRSVASLVHAAATPIDFASWSAIDPDNLTRHFAVHVAAPIALTGALLAAGPVERTVIFDSYSAATARPQWAGYSIVKAAAQMSFRAAAQELADTVVLRVYPGAVATPLLARVLAAPADVGAAAFYRSLEVEGRVSQPGVIAAGLADLLAIDPTTLSEQPERHLGHSA